MQSHQKNLQSNYFKFCSIALLFHLRRLILTSSMEVCVSFKTKVTYLWATRNSRIKCTGYHSQYFGSAVNSAANWQACLLNVIIHVTHYANLGYLQQTLLMLQTLLGGLLLLVDLPFIGIRLGKEAFSCSEKKTTTKTIKFVQFTELTFCKVKS